MDEQKKKKKIEELYIDALDYHLYRGELSDYQHEVEIRRRKALLDEI
jgi:hypothetical protein